MDTFNLTSKIHRKFHDPIDNSIEHHIFIVRCIDLPNGISSGANVRHASSKTLNKKVSKKMKSTLLIHDEEYENMFLHKNSGITLLADRVTKKSEKNNMETWSVQYDKVEEGILNGGHTYKVIQGVIADGELISDQQYVKIEVLTGVPQDRIVEIAEGLNTALKVADKDFENAREHYSDIQDLLKNEDYADQIAYESTDEGDIDIEFIIQLMFMMNIDDYPNLDDRHPVQGYSSKASVNRSFNEDQSKNNGRKYKKQLSILKDMLVLFNIIECGAPTSGGYVDHVSKQLENSLPVVSSKKPKKFHFIDYEHTNHLHKAFAYPIFASFRRFIRENDQGVYEWICDFDDIETAWAKNAQKLLKLSAQVLSEHGGKFSPFGKATSNWRTLHVEMGSYINKAKL